MFKIEFFCDDRRLAAALRGLVGIAHGPPAIVPVTNAVAKPNGKIAAKTSGDKIAMFQDWIRSRKLDEINSDLAREFCKFAGFSTASYTYVLNKARAAGVIRKVGKGTSSKWKVLS